jgi:hypothetical protein
MFLFARVVLKTLEQLHTLDEIKEEVRTLPKDLHEA